jgi:hypothetical protein
MPKYLTLQEWRLRSAFGPDVVLEHIARIDTILGLSAGTYGRFEEWEGDAAEDVDNALRRRYVVPFAATDGNVDITKVPRVIKKWVWQLLDCKLLDAQREAGATSPDDSRIAAFEEKTNAEMAKAADPNESAHPELPLRSDLPSSSGVALGGPLVFSSNTIQGYFDEQQRIRDEDGW